MPRGSPKNGTASAPTGPNQSRAHGHSAQSEDRTFDSTTADDSAATLQLWPALDPATEAALRASIQRWGVLVPIAKDQHGRIIDGHHRSRIADELGETYAVIVHHVDGDDNARELARTLNSDRRHLTTDQRREMVAQLRADGHSYRAIGRAIGVDEKTVRNDLSGAEWSAPELARVVGADGKSYPARKPAIIATSERQAGAAAEMLPRLAMGPHTGMMTVHDAARETATRRHAEIAALPKPPPPTGRYHCIVIDPPWPVEKINREARPNQAGHLDYPTMTLAEIEALPVADLVDDAGCHVYLWVTQRYLPAGLALFEAWGVRYQCALTWVKPTGMTPYSWMYNTEHVLFGRVGSLALDRMGLKLSIEAPATGHSAKPDAFYERVLAASPGPRLEMFARRDREGFTVWGNEVGGE